jgi:CHAT domain-containing protein
LHVHEADAGARELLGLLDRAHAVLHDGLSARGWDMPLPKPRVGQLDLFYFPLARGWVSFATDRTTTVTERLGPISRHASAEALSQSLLRPFRDRIEAASTVRILPSGWLQEVDFHALPWGSGALGTQRAVVYGMDLPAPPSAPAPNRARALVVADSRLDLPEARRAARRAAADLRQEPGRWQVTLLVGSQVTGSRLRQELPEADLFHFAGHGTYGGSTGFASALQLAEGGTLTTGDVLALPRVPRSVVLLGCETARAAEAVGPSPGLAQAFLLAGSEQVVAASRPLDDDVAAAVAAELYPAGGGSSAPDLGHALALLRVEKPNADWSSLRVLVP